MCALMQRSFPASIRDAVRPARLCGALDGRAEADVDVPFGAAKDKRGRDAWSQTHMNAAVIVMKYPAVENMLEMPLSQGDEEVQALSADRAD